MATGQKIPISVKYDAVNGICITAQRGYTIAGSRIPDTHCLIIATTHDLQIIV
jgi:hypothetical protein